MAYRLADVFPCVISDLIGGCVEVLGHLEGNGKNRVVVSYICRDLSILLAEDPERKKTGA